MANNLTGDFEAVVQIGVAQINGLLATLHQSGVSADAPLPLLHSASFRIGNARPRPPVADPFGDWVLEYQTARGPVGLSQLRVHLTGAAPPGAAKAIADLFDKFGGDLTPPPPPPPDTVRGRVRAQLSTLTLSVPGGSTSEVIVHSFVRAHYTPDAGTTDLPRPLHGEVRATFEAQLTQSATGKKLLIHPSSEDSKIQFLAAPGTGLSAADVARVSVQVRKAVRESFPLVPVDLPADFPLSVFKGLVGGAVQAIALPIQLSGAALPPGGVQGLNTVFLGPSGFAVAVGKEFIKAQFQGLIDKLLQFRRDIPIRIGPLRIATYHASVTSVDLQFNDGSIDFVVKGKATHPVWWDYHFTIKQRITLVMFLETLFVAAPDDELTISGLPGGATDRVRLEIVAERNRSLPRAQDALNQQLRAARTKLNEALHRFDPSTTLSLRAGHSEEPGAAASGAIAITADGVIIRGDIGGAAVRYAPIIDIAETDQGQAFTAFQSWIPAGRVSGLVWSWVEYPGPFAWSGVTKFAADEHRFILPKPPGITEASSICLQLQGTRTSPQGVVLAVLGGTACEVPDLGGILETPSWLEPVTVPVWLPDSAADIALKDAVAGHVSIQADARRNGELTHNTLVYFADWRQDEPLAVLVHALGQMRPRHALAVIVVLPAGAFDRSRREVEARFGSGLERVPARLLPTEDHEGGWTRTFGVARTPSAYLINARRQFVWKHDGDADAAELAGALQVHLAPAPPPRRRPLRLAVGPGDPAPDVRFADDRGNHFRLHRLRGRAVLLNFWQSWSGPSLRELGRLERLHKEAGGQAPFVMAFHGGKDRKTLGEMRTRHGFSVPLAHDAGQRIARAYGVRCWPTTVSVNADGLVDHVQFGIMHEHALPPEDRERETYSARQ